MYRPSTYLVVAYFPTYISYIKRTMKPPLTPRDEAAPEVAHSGPL